MLTIEMISEVIADEFGMTKNHIWGSRRTREISDVRQYCYLVTAEMLPSYTLKSISKVFGKDHATILYGLEAAKQKLKINENHRYKLDSCMTALRCFESSGKTISV